MPKDGHVNYVELPGGDLAAVKGFYGQAFGWTFTDYGPTYAAFGDAGIDGGFDADPDAGAWADAVLSRSRQKPGNPPIV